MQHGKTRSMNSELALPERLDRDAARNLHTELLKRRGGDLILDGSNVRTAGALAVQVLVAAARAWADDGRSISLTASAAMQEDLARLGVLNEFRLQEVT